MENPNCPICKGDEFIESSIKYELSGTDSNDFMSVIICKKCGAIVGTPVRHLYDNFLQIGYKLEEIFSMLTAGKEP